MSYTWVIGPLLYLPMIGLVGLAVAALGAVESRLPVRGRPAFAIVVALVFAAFALGSELYAESSSEPEALWTYVLARNPSSWLAHNNLGVVHLELADAQKESGA